MKYFLLKDKNYLKDLNKYFKQDYINKFYAKIYFYSGNEDSSIMNLLTYNEINNIMNETILILNENNKEFFNINDNIELSLQIKNINNLYLKIYQINTENYYYTKKEEIDPYISLDGIIPFFEKTFTINSKPQILLNKKLKISKLKKNRGLYIIELTGNKLVSRAIIQIGYLQCSYIDTPYGQIFYILDENNNVCKGRNTGIWMNNIWYQSNFKTGAILVPYILNGDKIIKH